MHGKLWRPKLLQLQRMLDMTALLVTAGKSHTACSPSWRQLADTHLAAMYLWLFQPVHINLHPAFTTPKT